MSYRDNTLDNVRDQPGLSTRQLAEYMSRPVPSTRRDLASLERDGLVTADRDANPQVWLPVDWKGPDA